MIDVFKIGVSISATNNVSSVLRVIQRDLFGLHQAIDLTQGKFDRLKLAAVGAMGAMVGIGTLTGMAYLVKSGEELVHQQAQLKNAGMTNADIAAATAASWKAIAQVQGTTVSDNLKVVGELRGQLGSTAAAIQFMPQFQKLGQVLSVGSGRPPGDEAYNALLAMDARGAIINRQTHEIDPTKLGPELDAMTQAIIASHYKLTPADFMNFARQAGPAGMGMSSDAFYGFLPTAMQVMGSQKAGTATLSFFQQIAAGIMTQRVGEELLRIGLIKPGSYHVRRGGHVVVDQGGIVNEGQFIENPFAWINTTMRAAFTKHGVFDEKGMDSAVATMLGPLSELGRTMSRQTSLRLVTDMLLNAPMFQRDFDLRKQALGANAANANNDANDPTQAMNNFRAAWSNLMTALGAPMVPAAVGFLNNIASTVTNVATMASKHPEAVKIIGGFAVAFGAVITILGGAAVMAAAVTALGALAAPAGLLGLAGGIVALGAAFKSIPGWLIAMATGAAVGGAAGSVIPVVGTAVGAGAGAIAGLTIQQLNAASSKPPVAPAAPLGLMYSAFGPANPAALMAQPPTSSQVLKNNDLSSVPAAATSNKGPVPVVVVNGKDIADGATKHLANQAQKPPSGPNFGTPSLTPIYPGMMGGL